MALQQFLTDISTDAKKLGAFQKDPLAAVKNAGLTDAEKAALFSGDASKIKAAVPNAPTAMAIAITIVIVF